MDKTGLLVIGVNLLIYAAYFTGVFLFSEQGITAAIRSFSLRRRLKPNDRGFLLDSGPVAYLNKILFATFQKEVNGAAFFFGIVMIFFIAFVLGIRLFRPGTALFAALMAASLPVMALVVRMESDRTKGSREGISFVSELYRQYRINNKNIYAAMEGTASSTGDFPSASGICTACCCGCAAAVTPKRSRNTRISFPSPWVRSGGICSRSASAWRPETAQTSPRVLRISPSS